MSGWGRKGEKKKKEGGRKKGKEGRKKKRIIKCIKVNIIYYIIWKFIPVGLCQI